MPNKQSEKTLYYNVITSVITADTKLRVDDHCNSWQVINNGLTSCFVNGQQLFPGVAGVASGESVSFGGNRAEIYFGRIDISFTGGAGSCTVFQKIYLPKIDRSIDL